MHNIKTIEEQINSIERKKEQKEKRKKEAEKIYEEDTRPDEIADRIKEKINRADFEEWQIAPIINKIKRGDVKSAVSDLNYLEGVELEEKEIEHFSNLPKETVLSWFKKFIDKE